MGGSGAARGLGVIGLLSSAFTSTATFLPTDPGVDLVGVRVVCAATAACALAMFLPWWDRLPLRGTLAMVPISLLLISLHNHLGGDDPFRYGIFYLALFVWIGMYHRPGTALLAAPPTLASYVVPLWVAGEDYAGWTAAYAVPMYVAVGEALARRSAALLRAQDRLDQLAHTDGLTGLPNRRSFLATARTAMDAPRSAGGSGAIAFIDLDSFKSVNDRDGHAAGDLLLQATALALRDAVRPGDVVARLAGDEFAVLLAGPITEREADAVSLRLREAVRAVADRTAPGLGVGASIGLAWCRDGDLEATLAAADGAMYEAKRTRARTRQAG